jgi:hypothetical protein
LSDKAARPAMLLAVAGCAALVAGSFLQAPAGMPLI